MKVRRWLLFLVFVMVSVMICPVPAEREKPCEHEWVLESVKKPTCTKEGKEKYRCSLCGETRTEKIPALGHEWGMCVMLREPTCTEEGVIRCFCVRDESHYKDETQPALGHQWDPWIVKKNASLLFPGMKTHQCGRCGVSRNQEIPALIRQQEYALAIIAMMILPLTIR